MSYRVAVRSLCEFTAKVGDLDLRFTPSPTAQEGIAGHRRVVARRGQGYEAEVALEGQFAGLEVRGVTSVRHQASLPAGSHVEAVEQHDGLTFHRTMEPVSGPPG